MSFHRIIRPIITSNHLTSSPVSPAGQGHRPEADLVLARPRRGCAKVKRLIMSIFTGGTPPREPPRGALRPGPPTPGPPSGRGFRVAVNGPARHRARPRLHSHDRICGLSGLVRLLGLIALRFFPGVHQVYNKTDGHRGGEYIPPIYTGGQGPHRLPPLCGVVCDDYKQRNRRICRRHI